MVANIEKFHSSELVIGQENNGNGSNRMISLNEVCPILQILLMKIHPQERLVVRECCNGPYTVNNSFAPSIGELVFLPSFIDRYSQIANLHHIRVHNHYRTPKNDHMDMNH
jgi:hypothetical protein